MRRSGRSRRGVALLVAFCAVGAVLSVASASAARVVERGTMYVGVTHTQFSADLWNDPASVTSARQILQRSFPIQNQHIMGWGAINPEPSPGVYSFGSLDKRVALMRATGARMVLTLCCAPDWMKGGAPGTTDWSRLEVAPTPDHYDDFVALAVTIAKRYPDVRDYLVWNELKGFFDSSRNRWNIEAYTDLYNRVYDALKAVNPAIRIGGPYITMNSGALGVPMSHPSTVAGPWGVLDARSLDAISYWLANAHGADYVVVDGGLGNRGTSADATLTNVAKLAAVNNWLRSKTSLPIVWSELDLGQQAAGDLATGQLLRAALSTLASSGASIVLLWQPQGRGTTCDACMWSDTSVWPGGVPSVPYQAVERALADQPIGPLDLVAPAPSVEPASAYAPAVRVPGG